MREWMTTPLAVLLLFRMAAADQVDTIIRSEMVAQHVPGEWVVVIKDGKVVKKQGYGIANLEDGSRVSTDTLMQTGSTGKMFTAAGILLLRDQGKLKLSDPISKFFPECPASWGRITLQHLLNHTGGIPDYEHEPPPIGVDLKKEYTEDQLTQFIFGLRLLGSPGEKWSYSNSDYVLLGNIIHKVSRQTWQSFLNRYLWKPAGMLTIRPLDDRAVIPNRSSGYDWENGKYANQDWVSQSLNSTADGTLYATCGDFIAWDRALDGIKRFSESTKREMWTPAVLSDGTPTYYADGWIIGEKLGHPWQGHLGSWQGFLSAYLRFPDEKLSVAVFCNSSEGSPYSTVCAISSYYAPELSLTKQRPISDEDGLVPEIAGLMDRIEKNEATPLPVFGALRNIQRPILGNIKTHGFGKRLHIDLLRRAHSNSNLDLTFRLVYKEKTLGLRIMRDPKHKYSMMRLFY